MSAFLSKLILEDEDGFPMTLFQSLLYQSDWLKDVVTVPAGFMTDLASIPFYLQGLVPKVGRYDKPAVIHDFLYAKANVNGRVIERGDADAVLKEAMAVCGVPGARLNVIYFGVRVGGWKSWRKYRKGEEGPVQQQARRFERRIAHQPEERHVDDDVNV